MLRFMRSLVAVLSMFVVACSTMAPSLPPQENVGAFAALSVADLDRVLPFYRDTLGFHVFSEGTPPDRPLIKFALLERGNALIEIVQLPDAKPRPEGSPALMHGFFKSGFVIDDIDAEYARLKGLNVTFAFELGQPPNGPYRIFGVRDPEGNLVQFFGK